MIAHVTTVHGTGSAVQAGKTMIHLSKEQETLLIPLYGKAEESRKKFPLFTDSKAEEIVSTIDYNFSSLKIPAKTRKMMCLRAKLFDNAVSELMKSCHRSVVLHLGCGLDSRYLRVQGAEEKTDWYDVDFSEVIDIRRHFFQETETYHLIPSSVTDSSWLEHVSAPASADGVQHLVIAEGLFMYLTEDEIKKLLASIQKKIGRYKLIFDAFSVFTAKHVKHHPSIKKTGASVQWGIDDPGLLEQWDSAIQFKREIDFTSNEELKHLTSGMRAAYRIAHLFPFVRKAQRILVYEIGSDE